MAPEVLYRVCFGESRRRDTAAIAKLSIRPAILHDHCRHKVIVVDYPAVIPQTGASVRGTYVTGLSDRDIRNLDWFEGDEYARKFVMPVLLKENQKGEMIEAGEMVAETYIWVDGVERLEKVEWDYDHFRKEKLKNWADTSSEYAGKLSHQVLSIC
jgi:hypothetical protein